MSKSALRINNSLQAITFLLNAECGCVSSSGTSIKNIELQINRIGGKVEFKIPLTEIDGDGNHMFLLPKKFREVPEGYYNLAVVSGDEICGCITAQKLKHCVISSYKGVYVPCNDDELDLLCPEGEQLAIVPVDRMPIIIERMKVDCRKRR